jgi:hypothetical protein
MTWCAIAVHPSTSSFTLFLDRESREHVDSIAKRYKLPTERSDRLRFFLAELRDMYSTYNFTDVSKLQFYTIHLLV